MILVAVFALVLFAGCTPDTSDTPNAGGTTQPSASPSPDNRAALRGTFAQDFTAEDFSIKLTQNFTEIDPQEGFLAMYANEYDTVLIGVERLGFSVIEEFGISAEVLELLSPAEYATGIGLTDEDGLVEEDGLVYYITSDETYTNFASVYKGNEAFWVVEFSVDIEVFDDMKADVIKWAKSVKITETE